MNFAKAIYRIRELRGLNQKEVSQKAGFSDRFIGMIERGDRSLTLATLEAVAIALNISTSCLYIIAIEEEDVSEIEYEDILHLKDKMICIIEDKK